MKKSLMYGLAVLMSLLMVMSGMAMAADMGMPQNGMPPMGPPPEGGPGGPGGPPGGGDGAPEEAAIVITDGAEDLDAEYGPGEYSALIDQEDGEILIDGLEMSSGDYTFNGLSITGPESVVRLRRANIRLAVNTPVTDNDKGGSAVNLDNGAAVYISDSNLTVDGAARYVTAAYNDATLVVNDSLVQSTGSNENTAEVSEPFSNAALLISGTARANFSIGATKTYYFNSTCAAEGWAALSTDSATGNGLDLYAYNTDGIAENGGYSTYADTNCRVWLYGSRLTAAEIGCIISKSGQIHAYNAGAADAELLQYNEGETVDTDTAIFGGRNAVMIHAPDMMGQGLYAADCGTFAAENTRIGTTEDLISTKDYNDYGEAVGAYIDYVSGSDILIRSTSANIELKNVEMESYNNTLIHTVLNADSMGNFLAPGDGFQVKPIWVHMEDMEVSGDIRHEDYQRWMSVELDHTTLSGNIISGTMERWNDTWKDYDQVNWVVDESFDATYGVNLTMLEGTVWNVTGESTLTGLTLSEGAEINGTVTVDGEEIIPDPGVTYTGQITVVGNYVPPEEEPEESEDPEAGAPDTDDETAETETLPAMETEEEQPDPAEPETEQMVEVPVEERTGRSGGIAAIIAIVVVAAAVCGAIVYQKKKKG